jgi:hypothetical protein
MTTTLATASVLNTLGFQDGSFAAKSGADPKFVYPRDIVQYSNSDYVAGYIDGYENEKGI